MRTLPRVIGSIALCFGSLSAFGLTLTPSRNGGTGDIPAYCGTTDFYLLVNDNVDAVLLPNSTCAGAVINIRSGTQAAPAQVVLENTDIPMASTFTVPGKTMTFTFDADRQQWVMKLPDLSPNTVGAVMPPITQDLSRYVVSEGNWTSIITLPETAPPGAILIVESHAKSGAKIAPTNVAYASTMNLAKNEVYNFVFHEGLQKWIIGKSPVAKANLQQATAGSLRAPTRPRTELELPANLNSAAIKLPASAGDRDRFRVTSLSTDTNTIRNDGVDSSGTLSIRNGDAYDFMWVAEKQRWVLTSSPTRNHSAISLANGTLPAMSSPTAKVYAFDANWQKNIALPAAAKPGDRVLVTSNATWGFNVVAGASSANFTTLRIERGDTRAFMVNAAGQWTVETPNIITMLNLYTDKVVEVYGAQAARARQLESFRITNQALENSRANFRVKMVGLMQIPNMGTTLNEPLDKLRNDVLVQSERVRLKADAIYFEAEGSSDGCGLGYLNTTPNRDNMIGGGNLYGCDLSTMRHEFGHNMGLYHYATEAVGTLRPYAGGYAELNTAMTIGGIAAPYYSTPLVYDQATGAPVGVPDKFDATRAMNEVSKEVSEFYR